MPVGKDDRSPLRIAVIGGGPAGSFFALYALQYAQQAGREVSITLYEGKDFRRPGPLGCNMCAGIVPVSDLRQFRTLGITVPPEMILSRIGSYALHTSAGTLQAVQPDAQAEIISVYRGSGPARAPDMGRISFDEMLLEEALARGARLKPLFAERIRRGRPVEVEAGGKTEKYDLVVLAAGVHGRSLSLEGFEYQPPLLGSMCQTELHLSREVVEQQLGSSVHIFLPPDEIAAYGILIPKGPFVTVSLLRPRHQMRSLRQFLDLREVADILGPERHPACGCLPKVSVGLARNIASDGFVAIGDASATRLYKNGIGSALATAERTAWTAIYRGCSRADFEAIYMPLCRSLHRDNQVGRLLFLQVPLLKRFGVVSKAHYMVAAARPRHCRVSELHARILWGMFTGAYSYRSLFRMAVTPPLVARLGLALGRSALGR